MSETAANPTAGPADADAVVNLLVREMEDHEAVDTSASAVAETADQSDTSQVTDPETETPEPEAEPTYTVKVRGAEVKVTLDELRSGYSRTEDYRAKTAELAEQRRAAEQMRSEIAARAQKLDEVLSQAPLDPVLAEGMKTDWQALARDNPAEYVAKRAEFDGRVQSWQRVQAARDEANRQAAQQRLTASEARMVEAVPEWSDPDRRKALQGDIARTLEGYGFNRDEYQHVADHRVLLVARDAMLYRQMMDQRKAAEAKKATPAAPRTVTPGTPQANKSGAQAKALLKTAAKSGRVDDEVNAILAVLEQG